MHTPFNAPQGLVVTGRSAPRHAPMVLVALAAICTLAPGTLAQRSAARPHASAVVDGDNTSIIMPQLRRPVRNSAVRLASVDARVEVADRIAATTLTLSLTNPSGTPQEAQLLLPVPEGATVRSMQYDGVGPEPVAELLPVDKARAIYDAIVAKAKDPALVEFAGYNLIRSSVFPVPAGATQKLTIVYEQLLPAFGDRIDYALPRSESFGDNSVTWTFSISINNRRPVSGVYSPSHEIVTQRLGQGALTTTLSPSAAKTPGSVRVSILLAPSNLNEPTGVFYAYPDPDVNNGAGGYFLFVSSPPPSPAGNTPRREVTLVIDRSGSMRGAKIEQAKAAAQQVVDGLAPGEKFNIIDYSDQVRMLSPTPLTKDNATAAEARAYIAAINAEGGTNIRDALVGALQSDADAEAVPMVLFLTDGLPTVGERNEAAIKASATAANKFSRRIFTFGVGFDVNAPLLSGIANATRGATTFILPDENVEVKVSEVFARLQGPILTEPTLTTPPLASGETLTDFQPRALSDVFQGDQIVVAGRYRTDRPVAIRLAGTRAGRELSYSFTFDPKSASITNGFVPRIWASRKIASLIDEIRQSGATGDPTANPQTKELVDEIVRLSTRWGVLTEYTAFLAADDAKRDLPAAAPMAMDNLRKQAVSGRAGGGAVAQERNIQTQALAPSVAVNTYKDEQMREVEIRGVQPMNDRVAFRRSGRWVDSALAAKESEKPDEEVNFATPRYNEIVVKLAQTNRQGLLALGGDVYLLLDGRRILVHQPAGD